MLSKIVATSIYITIVFIGEFYLYRWMVRKNVFGASQHEHSGDTEMIRMLAMTTYAILTTALYTVVMQHLSDRTDKE